MRINRKSKERNEKPTQKKAVTKRWLLFEYSKTCCGISLKYDAMHTDKYVAMHTDKYDAMHTA